MRASRFIAEVERLYGASVVLTDGTVRVQDAKALPKFVKLTIVRHRPSLQAFLAAGKDVELDQQKYDDDELRALGCLEILVEETLHDDGRVSQLWTWTHEAGDEVFDQILVGLLDAGEVKARRAQAEADSIAAVWSKRNPPRGSIFTRLFGRRM